MPPPVAVPRTASRNEPMPSSIAPDSNRAVKLSLRVPADFRRKLRILAAGQDSDMQAMVVDALVAKYPELRK
jgi:hypothetical protein